MYIDNDGKLSMEEVKSKISEKTKIVGITHISNALGTINPVDEIISYAHSKRRIGCFRWISKCTPYEGRCKSSRCRFHGIFRP